MRESPAPIDPHEFDSLNREFYAADPAEVIDHRLWMLARFLGDESTEARYEADDLSLSRDAAPSGSKRVQFVALESTLILHQAAETLLRLYFAHANDAACPWAEMTNMRSPGVFTREVRTLRDGLGSDSVIRDLLTVVSWSGDRKKVEASVSWSKKGGWTRHREGVRSLFQFACDTVLDGADLYNAGKHGLAILPGERGVKVDDGAVISQSGPSLTVIEPQQFDGEPRWTKTVVWISYSCAVMMTAHMSVAIRSLWACGKQRRTGEGNQAHIHIFDSDELTEALRLGASNGISVQTMSHVLFDLHHPMWTSTPS
ncbi:hypothetical protein QF046_001684 [Microbacterium sp. W4I4]|uniref:hypothetical protein n=1 Tax=Microbacterium sp. W4I4 TaxID=3042295 RepID=UPI002788B955|nr:hypothetical protein [Microbacterium sp. W4I4]MDQ0614043.1 hypothetical protein [Microbacterium sp. W4I4]